MSKAERRKAAAAAAAAADKAQGETQDKGQGEAQDKGQGEDKEDKVEKQEQEAPKPPYTALAVFAAHVAARSGKGSVTAVVRSTGSGQSALLGSRNLLNIGLLSDDKYRKAPSLASVLSVPLVIGKAKCTAWLSEHKIEGIAATDILGDPPNSALSSVKVGNSRKDLSF